MFEALQGLYQASLEPVITLGWPLSTLDFIILAFNLTCVYLVGKNNILNYPIGMVAIVAYTFMCFSFGFYSEFFLQIYFFIASIIGWYMWRDRGLFETLQPRYIGIPSLVGVIVMWAGCAAILGTNIDALFAGFVELIAPVLTVLNSGVPIEYVHSPAAYPYIDAFTTVGQVIAMIMMMRKFVESWYIWLTINAVSAPMFYLKGGYGITIMFTLFFLNAMLGLYRWRKLEKEHRKTEMLSPISHLHS
ncbi:TMhelix containing protein [Vibrio phage 2.275.O._10N.286.54.E11]|nr:TMhelix containing protein [Vibrio phage 2.275.O._10N.286.54.E11]